MIFNIKNQPTGVVVDGKFYPVMNERHGYFRVRVGTGNFVEGANVAELRTRIEAELEDRRQKREKAKKRAEQLAAPEVPVFAYWGTQCVLVRGRDQKQHGHYLVTTPDGSKKSVVGLSTLDTDVEKVASLSNKRDLLYKEIRDLSHSAYDVYSIVQNVEVEVVYSDETDTFSGEFNFDNSHYVVGPHSTVRDLEDEIADIITAHVYPWTLASDGEVVPTNPKTPRYSHGTLFETKAEGQLYLGFSAEQEKVQEELKQTDHRFDYDKAVEEARANVD